MRITEAIAALATEYPMYSKSKLKTALKIEMQKTAEVEDALNSARGVINSGTLSAHGDPLYSDPTGNEVVAREGQTAAWKIANPIGSVATKGRTGLTAEEIEKINAATKVAEAQAKAWRAS